MRSLGWRWGPTRFLASTNVGRSRCVAAWRFSYIGWRQNWSTLVRPIPMSTSAISATFWVKELDGEDDMEIRWGHGQWPGLVSQRLTWDTLFPVCSPALMARSPLKVAADVAHHPLLHVLGYEEGWGYWLNMVGADTVDSSTGMQFDTLICTLRMAELGQG